MVCAPPSAQPCLQPAPCRSRAASQSPARKCLQRPAPGRALHTLSGTRRVRPHRVHWGLALGAPAVGTLGGRVTRRAGWGQRAAEPALPVASAPPRGRPSRRGWRNRSPGSPSAPGDWPLARALGVGVAARESPEPRPPRPRPGHPSPSRDARDTATGGLGHGSGSSSVLIFTACAHRPASRWRLLRLEGVRVRAVSRNGLSPPSRQQSAPALGRAGGGLQREEVLPRSP